MALFYQAKEDKRIVKAEASADSKKVLVFEADGKDSAVNPVEFAAKFDKAENQEAAEAVFVAVKPAAPVVAEVKAKKKDEATV